MSLNFGKIPSLTSELAALERLKSDDLCCDHSSTLIFDWIFNNKETHKIYDGFEIGQDRTRDLWVTCPWAFGKIPIDLYWEICDHSSAFNFELILFILADKKDNYKSLDEFEFHQDPITYYRVSFPGAS